MNRIQKVQGKMTKGKKWEKARVHDSFQEGPCNYSSKKRTDALGKSCNFKMIESILKHNEPGCS